MNRGSFREESDEVKNLDVFTPFEFQRLIEIFPDYIRFVFPGHIKFKETIDDQIIFEISPERDCDLEIESLFSPEFLEYIRCVDSTIQINFEIVSTLVQWIGELFPQELPTNDYLMAYKLNLIIRETIGGVFYPSLISRRYGFDLEEELYGPTAVREIMGKYPLLKRIGTQLGNYLKFVNTTKIYMELWEEVALRRDYMREYVPLTSDMSNIISSFIN